MTVFLYDYRRRIDLTLRETYGSINWNLPMDISDFKIYKNVSNSIEFQVRNTDRKPVSMLGRTAHLTIYDHRINKVLLTKELDLVNEARSIVRLTITPDVIDDWDIGQYSYVVRVTNIDGSEVALYVDQNEGIRGFVELATGPYPPPRPSVEIPFEEFTPIAIGLSPELYYISSAMPGSMKSNNSSGLHTLVVFMEQFTGKMWIEGSLEQGTPSINDWFTIQLDGKDYQSFCNSSGTLAFTFKANLEWARVKFYPSPDIPKDKTSKINKIEFRN